MIQVSEAYKQASESNERVSYVVAKFGLYNKTAKTKIENVESDSQPFSNISKTYNEIKKTNYNYISCEPNRVKLDGSFYFIEDKNKPNRTQSIAYWSDILSNSNGLFNYNPKIIYMFSEKLNFTEITLYFQEVCEEFVVNYYNENTIIASRNIKNNLSLVITTNGTITLNESVFDKLEIEFIKTKEPYRYIKFNEIDFGVYKQFSREQIIDFDIIDELSLDSSELSSNSLNISIDNSRGQFDILNPKSELQFLEEKQEISLYHYLRVGNNFQELPLGTFLLKRFDINNKQLEINAYDDIYFMNDIYYGSKFYQNEEITNILIDLFSYFNYTNYVIDEELQGIKLTGYIPNVAFREALRLIAEAGCCVINKTRYGITYIFKTYDPITKKFNRRIILNEKPKRNLFNNIINLIEYNYSVKEENVEIYNAKLNKGIHTILYSKFPIEHNSVVKSDNTNEDYRIINTYATSCIIEVLNEETNVILNGTFINESSIEKKIKKENIQEDISSYAITKVNNRLITSSNLENVGKWKLNRSDIKYSFKTLVMPYIEVGDTCEYETKYGTKNTFIPTRLRFSKSILQNIEGE